MKHCVSLLFVVLTIQGVRADEGRIPIHNLAGPPFVILHPGSYILTQNIELPAQGTAIDVLSDNVRLDLNGMAVTAPGPGAVLRIADGHRAVTIRNGHLRGSISGNNVASAIRIVNLSIEGSIELSGVEEFEIVSCSIVPIGGGEAIFARERAGSFGGLAGFLARIEDNAISTAGGIGILLEGMKGGQVLNNRIRENGGGGGIVVTGGHNLIQANSISHVGVSGITASGMGNQIRHNMIDFAQTGLTVNGYGSIVVGNTVTNSLGTAASFATGNSVIRENVFRQMLSGVTLIGRGNRFEGNEIDSTTLGVGLYVFGEGNILRSNVVSSTASATEDPAIQIDGRSNLLDLNQVFSNSGFGIAFEATSTGNICRDNVLFQNEFGPWTGPAQVDGGGNSPSPLCQ